MLSFRSRRSRQILATISAASIAVFSAAGAASATVTYNLVVAGSTTLCPFVFDNVATYDARYPDSQVVTRTGTVVNSSGTVNNLDCPGSGTGIKTLLQGATDVADASRPVFAVENAPGAFYTPAQVDQVVVGLDGITMIVNPNVTGVTGGSLKVSDIRHIYDCSVTNWSVFGGPNATIVPISRTSASGTFGDFMSFISGDTGYNKTWNGTVGTPALPGSCVRAGTPDSNPGLVSNVKSTPFSIAFVGYGFAYTGGVIDAGLAVLGVDGTMPTQASVRAAVNDQVVNGPYPYPISDTIAAGKYPFGRQLFMDMINYTTAQNLASGGAQQARVANNFARGINFINVALSATGQTNVVNEGEIGLATPSATNSSLVCNGANPNTFGYYCPNEIPSWDVNVDGGANIGDIVVIGSNWQGSAPAGVNGGWIRADVCGGAGGSPDGGVNIADVGCIGTRWQQSWASATASGASSAAGAIVSPWQQ